MVGVVLGLCEYWLRSTRYTHIIVGDVELLDHGGRWVAAGSEPWSSRVYADVSAGRKYTDQKVRAANNNKQSVWVGGLGWTCNTRGRSVGFLDSSDKEGKDGSTKKKNTR